MDELVAEVMEARILADRRTLYFLCGCVAVRRTGASTAHETFQAERGYYHVKTFKTMCLRHAMRATLVPRRDKSSGRRPREIVQRLASGNPCRWYDSNGEMEAVWVATGVSEQK